MEQNTSEQLESMLRETRDLTRQNNDLLKKIRRVQKIGQITRMFYWILIIGVTFGAFYFIQPYIKTVTNLYGGNANSISDFESSLSEVKYFNKFFEQMKGEETQVQ